MDPITYGVIDGLLGLTLAGQSARDAKKKKEAEDAATSAAKSKEKLLGTITGSGNAEAANIFLSNTWGQNWYRGQSQTDKMNILTTAQMSFQTAEQKSWIEAAKSSKEGAVSLLMDMRLLENPSFVQVKPLILSYATAALSADERSILDNVGNDKVKANAYLASSVYPKEHPVSLALKSIVDAPADPGTYNALSKEVYAQIDTLSKKPVKTDAITLVTDLQARTKDFVKTSPEALLDNIRLKAIQTQLASKEGSIAPIYDLMKTTIDQLNDVKNKGTVRSSAADTVKIVKELRKGLPLEQWKPENRRLYTTLVNMSKAMDDKTVHRVAYTNDAGKELIALRTEKPLLEEPFQWLLGLNRFDASAIKTAYNGMSSAQKQNFTKDVITALTLDNENQQKDTIMDGQVRVAPGARDYSTFIPSVVKALPFVKTHLQDVLKLPRPGQTENGKALLPKQVADDGVTPLDQNAIRVVDGGTVFNATPEVIAFAEGIGTTPQAMFNTDAGMLDLVMPNADEPFELFNAARGIQESSIFFRKVDKDLSGNAPQTLAFILGRNGITDRGQQLDVIAANLSGKMPAGFQPRAGRLTIPAVKFGNFIRIATGRNIELDDIAKGKENAANFMNLLARAQSRLKQMGPGSRLTDELRALYLNLFSLQGNFFSQAAGGAKTVIKDTIGRLVNVSDMRNDTSGSASTNKEGIETTIENFLNKNWSKMNSEMASLGITLAYGYAKTMDPSGRISERDFSAALKAVMGNISDPRDLQLEVIDDLMDRANDNLVRNSRMFGFVARAQSGDNFFQPTEAEVRLVRSLRYVDTVIRHTQDLQLLEEYQDVLGNPNMGFGSVKFNQRYALTRDRAVQMFGQRFVLNNNITEIRKKVLNGPPVSIMGGLFVDSATGTIFSKKQIQEFRQASRNSI